MLTCPYCRTVLRPAHLAPVYRCGACRQTFRVATSAPSALRAATRSGLIFVGAQERHSAVQDKGHGQDGFEIRAIPDSDPQELRWRAVARHQVTSRARDWLDELEHWAAEGLAVPDELLASAKARADRL